MKLKDRYSLMIQILELLSDKQLHHINELIVKLLLLNNLSNEERDRLIQTNNDKIIIKSFDQHVQIALIHLLVFNLIKANQVWSFNIEYTTSYCLTDKGIKFINDNNNKGKVEIADLLIKEMDQISKSLIRKK